LLVERHGSGTGDSDSPGGPETEKYKLAGAKRNDQERQLFEAYLEDGDLAARERLVARFLPLARQLARRYGAAGEPIDDLIQVASLGLVKAIDRYDLDRDVALTTYATPNVVGEIKRYFRDKAWAVRVPRGLQELHARLAKTIDSLTADLGRSPSIAEIAKNLESTPEQVLEALETGSAYSTISLSADSGGGEDQDPMEAIGEDDEGYERTEDRASLQPALDMLPAREREILRLRFEEGLTQTQIAERFEISQMHVSRLIRKSLERMRRELS
jgi:RNA polymerase sigma-B factor